MQSEIRVSVVLDYLGQDGRPTACNGSLIIWGSFSGLFLNSKVVGSISKMMSFFTMRKVLSSWTEVGP